MATEFCPSGITAKVTRFKTILPHLITLFVVGFSLVGSSFAQALPCQRPVGNWRSTASGTDHSGLHPTAWMERPAHYLCARFQSTTVAPGPAGR
jgi:hypothetical protein